MRRFLFRFSALLLVLSSACCPLSGQQKGVLSKKTVKDLQKTPKTHGRDTQLIRRPFVPKPVLLTPAGDVRLRRFGTRVFEFDSISARDTLQVLLVNKDGIPFKKVELTGGTIRQPARGFVEYKFRDAMAATHGPAAKTKPVLRAKPALSLKRQTVFLEVQHFGPAGIDTLLEIVETRIDTNLRRGLDTLIRRWQILPGGKSVMIAEDRRAEDASGLISRTTKQLLVSNIQGKADTLPGGLQPLRRLKETVLRYEAFKPGDTLVFSVKAAGKKPLKEVYLSNDRDRRIAGAVDAAVFDHRLVVDTEKFINLHLKSTPGLRKQYADVSVWRIRPTRPDSIFNLVDSSVFRIDTLIQYDTLLMTILDDSLLLAPLLNIEAEPFGRLALEIPKTAPGTSASLYAFSYWVGVGVECLASYAALEKTVPADWSRPGAPVALGAYGLGRPVIMPPITTADVDFVFSQSGERIGQKKPKSLYGLSLQKNAGAVALGAAGKPATYRFFACFENRNTVLTHPVKLKVVAYYRKEKSRSMEIKALYSNKKNQ